MTTINIARKIHRYDKKIRSLLSKDNIYHTGHAIIYLTCAALATMSLCSSTSTCLV